MPTKTLPLTIPDLVAALRCSATTAGQWLNPLIGSAVIHDINTPERMAAWLACMAYESRSLTKLEEDLNYKTPARIRDVWPIRFGPGKANPGDYVMQPAKLANFVYANRLGNTALWDGWNYRGRGPLMLTGRANYTDCAAGINTDIVAFPDLVTEPPVGAMTAGWYWVTHGLNDLADDDDFGTIVMRLQGGMQDYETRLLWLGRAKVALARYE